MLATKASIWLASRSAVKSQERSDVTLSKSRWINSSFHELRGSIRGSSRPSSGRFLRSWTRETQRSLTQFTASPISSEAKHLLGMRASGWTAEFLSRSVRSLFFFVSEFNDCRSTTLFNDFISVSSVCSHLQTPKYWAESVRSKNPRMFPAKSCASYDDFKNNKCMDESAFMGLYVDETLNGRFYLNAKLNLQWRRRRWKTNNRWKFPVIRLSVIYRFVRQNYRTLKWLRKRIYNERILGFS